MSRFAIIDIGSSSVKFLFAEVEEIAGGEAHIQIVEEQSHSTRLAEHLLNSAELTPEAILRTLHVLDGLRQRAQELKADYFRAVATSAVRDAKNRKEFLSRARDVLGFPVRLLSGEEEAETIFCGVTADPYWKGRDLLAFDIGGGSTEWIQGCRGKMEKRLSLPLGCVRLRERFVTHYPLGEAGAKRLYETVFDQVRVAMADFQLAERELVGTGGTLSCLVTIEKAMTEYDVLKIDHAQLTKSEIGQIFKRLTSLTLEEIQAVPGIPKKRADIILPGIALVLAIMEALKAPLLQVSTRGLRYGVLQGFLKERAKEA